MASTNVEGQAHLNWAYTLKNPTGFLTHHQEVLSNQDWVNKMSALLVDTCITTKEFKQPK
jgi:hypothetical protein